MSILSVLMAPYKGQRRILIVDSFLAIAAPAVIAFAFRQPWWVVLAAALVLPVVYALTRWGSMVANLYPWPLAKFFTVVGLFGSLLGFTSFWGNGAFTWLLFTCLVPLAMAVVIIMFVTED